MSGGMEDHGDGSSNSMEGMVMVGEEEDMYGVQFNDKELFCPTTEFMFRQVCGSSGSILGDLDCDVRPDLFVTPLLPRTEGEMGSSEISYEFSPEGLLDSLYFDSEEPLHSDSDFKLIPEAEEASLPLQSILSTSNGNADEAGNASSTTRSNATSSPSIAASPNTSSIVWKRPRRKDASTLHVTNGKAIRFLFLLPKSSRCPSKIVCKVSASQPKIGGYSISKEKLRAYCPTVSEVPGFLKHRGSEEPIASFRFHDSEFFRLSFGGKSLNVINKRGTHRAVVIVVNVKGRPTTTYLLKQSTTTQRSSATWTGVQSLLAQVRQIDSSFNPHRYDILDPREKLVLEADGNGLLTLQ